MLYSKFFKVSCLLCTGYLTACMSATDPGLAQRYNVEFTSPASVVGKKFHWSAMPVKLRHTACSVTGCTTGIVNAVERGIQFWQKNVSLFGEIQTSYGEPADIEIQYVISLGGNLIGKCSGNIYTTSTGRYVIATPISISIATTVGGAPLSTSELEFVAAHEMGHCLGLWDHSPTEGDLMNAQLTGNTAYSVRDLNSLRWLYTQTSDVIPYPSSAISQQMLVNGEVVASPPLQLP